MMDTQWRASSTVSRSVLRPTKSDLADEISTLPDSARLASTEPFDVYLARSSEAPQCLVEIGFLRAEVFPEARQGNAGVDLDEFDTTYEHLFVWNAREREIVGAYRIARTDQVSGPEALYTSTLFTYDKRLTEQLSPAIELGRSFVRPEQQRSFAPLHLLWRGLGALIAREKRYKYLFGALTIRNEFSTPARDLLLDFLESHAVDDELRGLVSARRPVDRVRQASVGDIRDVGQKVREIESGLRDVPVLMRHYHRLGARSFDFSVDTHFGNSIDALVLVELVNIPKPILARYLGTESSQRFLDYHAARVRRTSRR